MLGFMRFLDPKGRLDDDGLGGGKLEMPVKGTVYDHEAERLVVLAQRPEDT